MNDLILRLGVALAIGLLVGLERGWREREQPDGSRTAGLRTFGIFGLMGGLCAATAQAMAAPVVLAAGFLGLAGVYGLFQYCEIQRSGSPSVTTTIAGLSVFVLGAFAVSGDYRAAAAAATALAAILASREVTHQALRALTWVEIRSALVLAVMSTIILPLLPNRAVDPWGGLNPWQVWFFTVLVASISFLGYIAVRVLGPRRGLLVSGLAGALVSSTAVTVALARMAGSEARPLPLAGTAALAGAVSVLRVTGVVVLLVPQVSLIIAPVTLVAAAVLAGAGGLMLVSGAPPSSGTSGLRNPFELRALLAFAGLFALVSTVSAALVARFGSASLLVTTAISGLLDSDVATLSALRLADQPIGLTLIGMAVLVAVASNAGGRCFLALLAGPAAFWLPLSGATLAAVFAGAGMLWAVVL